MRPHLLATSLLFALILAPATVRAAGSAPAAVADFGANPGKLQMFEHVPAGLAASKPMVVVLHGCTEGAANAAATGWDELADANGFLVVYPQQPTSNNPVSCFNWAGVYGDPSNIQRGKLENASIKSMVDHAITAHGSDPKRVYLVGFSAGGAYAAVMAATYPDVFAGIGIMAGVPYDCTTTYSEVSNCQSPGKTKTAAQWGDLVRAAYASYAGPYPKVSIWQGDADTTVGTANRTELIKQWTNVLGAPEAATTSDTVDGQKHTVYKDAKGVAVVESYEVAGMNHAVPVSPSKGCGQTSTYAQDKGICAAQHIASFLGVTAPLVASPDGGAASSSSSSSSSTSSGGAADGGAPNGAAPSDEEGSFGSTCAMAPPRTTPSLFFFVIAASAVVVSLRRKAARR